MRAYAHLLRYRRSNRWEGAIEMPSTSFTRARQLSICLSFTPPSHVHICLFLSSSAAMWVEQSDVSITASTSHCFPIHKTGSSLWEVDRDRERTREREIEHSLVLLSGSRIEHYSSEPPSAYYIINITSYWINMCFFISIFNAVACGHTWFTISGFIVHWLTHDTAVWGTVMSGFFVIL